MRPLKLLVVLLLASSFSFGTAAASGKLVNPDTTGAIPGYVQFDLQNCGFGNFPEVSGAGIGPQQKFNLASDGSWSGNLYRNDEIFCNGSPSTWWRRSYWVNFRQVGAAVDYICSQTSCVFDGAGALTPLTVYPAPAPPSPPLISLQPKVCPFTSASTWTCTHNFGVQPTDVQFRDSNWKQIFPDTDTATDVNTETATWLQPQSGYMIVLYAGNSILSTANPNYIVGNPSSDQPIVGDHALAVGGSFSAKRITTAPFVGPNPWYDVTMPDYGAKEDGATNDAAAIQSAITAACAAGGGTIRLPAHTSSTARFFVNTTITLPCDNLTIEGDTGHAVANGPPNPPSYIVATSLNAPVFQTTGGQRNGITFKNFGILGSVSNTSEIGIQLQNGSGWLIRDVYIQNMGGPCVQVQAGANNGKIESSFFTGCINGNSASDTGAIDINQADIDVLNTYVDCGINSTSQVGTGHTFGVAMKSSSGTSKLTNVRADFCQHGILLASSRNQVTAGRAFHNQGNAIVVSGSDNQISGFQSLGNSQNASGAYSGFNVTGSSNSFIGNYIDAAGGDVNLQLNAFDDSNSAGGGGVDVFGNKYLGNSIGNGAITGVKYNMTGTAVYRIEEPHRAYTQTTSTGSISILPAVDADTQIFNTPFTGAVTVTLSTTGAYNGARFRVIRGPGATGAFNLTVNPVGTVFGSANQYADFEYISGAWAITASGPLVGNIGNIGLVGTAQTWTALQMFSSGISIGTGVAGDGSGFKHKRISTGSIGATTRAEVLLTWGTAFADASYTVHCSVEDSTTAAATQGLTLERLKTHSASQVGAIINNPTAGGITGTLDCEAAHD